MTDPLGLISNAGTNPAVQKLARQSAEVQGTNEPSFKEHLMGELREANRLGEEANKAANDLLTGQTDNFDAVFTAQKKAEIAFQTLLQVRNKVMDAYNEVKQIRV